eukprot:TRINITY_DN2620_c0_g1_i3.p1 TRINITY_DN2620_c0_g1~~TRINITY_DN2620_c0_g1_i3.p1  ORF type:complete len:182 (-),score=23.24 TRINITY_DN2620_c0_g1_i3:77-622(-)
MDPEDEQPKGIVLFDGVCNMCNGLVNFCIDNDPKQNLAFASLQSPVGQSYIEKHKLEKNLGTVVLIEGDRAYIKSTAALRASSYLRWPYPLLFYIFILVPWFIRDLVYNMVAATRYALFGKSEQCRIPTRDFKNRFLDWPEQQKLQAQQNSEKSESNDSDKCTKRKDKENQKKNDGDFKSK